MLLIVNLIPNISCFECLNNFKNATSLKEAAVVVVVAHTNMMIPESKHTMLCTLLVQLTRAVVVIHSVVCLSRLNWSNLHYGLVRMSKSYDYFLHI